MSMVELSMVGLGLVLLLCLAALAVFVNNDCRLADDEDAPLHVARRDWAKAVKDRRL